MLCSACAIIDFLSLSKRSLQVGCRVSSTTIHLAADFSQTTAQEGSLCAVLAKCQGTSVSRLSFVQPTCPPEQIGLDSVKQVIVVQFSCILKAVQQNQALLDPI